MRSVANPQVNTEAQLNRDLSAWWLHLPGHMHGYRNRHLSGCPAAPSGISLEADGPGTAQPSKGVGQAPPGRWGSWNMATGGATDYVSIPDAYTQLLSGQNVHTISMWVLPRSFSNSPVYLSDGSSGTAFYALLTTSGYVSMGYDGGTRTYTSGQCTVNAWHHLCHVKTGSGNSGNLYVNGVLASSYTGSYNSAAFNSRALWFGSYGTTSFGLDGCIDDVRIYKTRALDADEAYQLYREGLRGYPTLLRWNRRRLVSEAPVAADYPYHSVLTTLKTRRRTRISATD